MAPEGEINMAGIQVIEHKCVGCKKCQNVCPYEAIDMVEKLAVINCSLCGEFVQEVLVYMTENIAGCITEALVVEDF